MHSRYDKNPGPKPLCEAGSASGAERSRRGQGRGIRSAWCQLAARRPPHAEGEGSNPSVHLNHAGEVLKGGRSARTREGAGSIPAAGSDSPAAQTGGFFALSMRMPVRALPPVAWFPGEHNGPEALTVERPVETRQAELRALPGPPTRGATAAHLRDRQGAGGSTPPSSTVTEAEVVEAPQMNFDSVAPEAAGSSPAGHPNFPTENRAGGLVTSRAS
jgi:hypothetical protein